MPDSTAICGNIDTPSTVNSSGVRPRNWMRPSAYAASTASPSDRITVDTATKIEFRMLRPNGCSRNTAT
jgi:hypothetical protein